jgi:hypothetical protein
MPPHYARNDHEREHGADQNGRKSLPAVARLRRSHIDSVRGRERTRPDEEKYDGG